MAEGINVEINISEMVFSKDLPDNLMHDEHFFLGFLSFISKSIKHQHLQKSLDKTE